MKFSKLFILFFFIFPALLLCFIGSIKSEEGYILLMSSKFLNGDIPYKDFSFVYPPISIFITAIILKINSSILIVRLFVLAINLLGAYLIKKIIFLSTSNKLYSSMSSILFLTWAISQNYILTVESISTFFSILFFYFLSKFFQTRNRNYLFLTGIIFAITFLTSYIFGIALVIPIIIFFIIKSSRKFSYLYYFILGLCWGIIPFTIYLLISQSFNEFVKKIFTNNILRDYIVYKKNLSEINFLSTDLFIPLIFVSLSSIILLYIRRRFHLIPIASFIFIITLISLLIKDFPNLSFITSLISIPLVLYLRYNLSNNIRIMIFLILILMPIVGIFSFSNNITLKDNKIYPLLSVGLLNSSQNEFSILKKYVNGNTKDKDYIYFDFFAPEYHFLLNRREILQNYFVEKKENNKKYYDRVIGHIIAKNPKLIILKNDNKNAYFIKFLNEKYKKSERIGKYSIFIKLDRN